MTNTRFIGDVLGREDRLTPYVGYKVVAIGRDEQGGYHLRSPHFTDATIGFSAESECKAGKKHTEFENCSCGFYAYRRVQDAVDHWRHACGDGSGGYSNFAVVQVALSGSVVTAEKGFRATHQRIQHVLMPRCWSCNAAAGTRFVFHQAGYLVAGCDSCSAKFQAIEFDEFSKVATPEGMEPIRVSSARDLNADAVTILAPAGMVQEIEQMVDVLIAAGRVDLVDSVINTASKKLSDKLAASFDSI